MRNKYIKVLRELFKVKSFPPNPKNSIHDLLKENELILYGAGEGFITFYMFVLKKYGLKAKAVLDKKFNQSDIYFGIPAYNPYHFKPTKEEIAKSVVVITVGKKEYHEEILGTLYNLGFKNISLATDIYEYHTHLMPRELEEKGFTFYLENQEKIERTLTLMADEISKKIYINFISTHMTKKVYPIYSQSLNEQYFPKDIILNKGYKRFINCGAYTGDTIERLKALHGKVEAVACFEPDPDNFKILINYLRLNRNTIADSVIALPCGVFRNEIQLKFASGNRSNSMISEEGDIFIQCVSLDHVLQSFNPTFISMDIEGAEMEALKGAEKTIVDSKPDLAICVYHLPNHIWDIPMYLDSLKLKYKFFLRNYSGFVSETVLYATQEA